MKRISNISTDKSHQRAQFHNLFAIIYEVINFFVSSFVCQEPFFFLATEVLESIFWSRLLFGGWKISAVQIHCETFPIIKETEATILEAANMVMTWKISQHDFGKRTNEAPSPGLSFGHFFQLTCRNLIILYENGDNGNPFWNESMVERERK